MHKLISNYKLLLLLYAGLVIVIGSFFLVSDIRVMHEVQHELPLLFLIRFSLFWLMCLIIALAGYLLYFSHMQFNMPEPDKAYAARLGRLAFYVGATGSSLAFIFLLTLREYPFL